MSLVFCGVDIHIVMRTPLSQVSNLFPISCFIVVCYQSNYGGVICKFDDGVGRVNGGTIMCKKGVEEGAEDTPL